MILAKYECIDSRIKKIKKREKKNCTFPGVAAVSWVKTVVRVLSPTNQDGVVGMGFDMLLQILGSLKGLAAEVTFVRLQRNVNTNVRSDMVSLDGCCPA